jgi:hypothetical protein
MRAGPRAATAAAVCVLLALPALAQGSGQAGTPQGRPVSKAKKAAGAAEARQQQAGQQDASAQGQAEGAGTTQVLDDVRRSEEAAATGLGLSYDPQGRRDPFVSPAEAVKFEEMGQCEGEGSECWLIAEVDLVGIMGRHGGSVALVVGPDGYGATLKPGDKLYDGEVLRVNSLSGTVVFRQKVNDPTRIKPYRDIEKMLSMTREDGV